MRHPLPVTFGALALALVLWPRPSFAAADSQVVVYPFPAGLPVSNRFQITVDEQAVFTHAAEVADFAMFAIRGPVEVTVVCHEPVTNAILRPRSRNIVPQWDAQTVRFTVDSPGPLSLEINGKIRPALLLFIDPPEDSPPAPGSPHVVRFAGGQLHEAGEIQLRSRPDAVPGARCVKFPW